MKTEQIKLELKNELTEVNRAVAALEKICLCLYPDRELRFQLRLLLEELLVNIITHGFPEGGAHSISLEIIGEPRRVAIHCIDAGILFDINASKDPDLSLPPEDRPIGGLGVLLIKRTADEIIYRRENEQNHNTIIKYIHAPC